VPENTGAVTAAETTVEPAMPRKFTIPEHEQRFKSKWSAGRQKALLGAGTFAQVFREYDTQEGVFVAHKIPNTGAPSMEEEVAIMTKLAGQCVNLVQILGVVVASHDTEANPLGILMEYCSQSLHDHWQREMGLVAIDVQRRCLSHLLRGLRHLHASGIVHLDLVPKNILLHWHAWGGLCTKISDFGSAQFLASAEVLTSKEKVTTWPYRAPEVALGLPYKHAVDVWAVGVLARELATGRRLYELANSTRTDVQYIHFMAGPLRNSTWPDVESAPFWEAPPRNFSPDSDELTRHAQVHQDGVCFARRLLKANPQERPTAAEALLYRYLAFGQIGVPLRLRRKAHVATPFLARRPAPSNAVSLAGGVARQAVPKVAALADGPRRRCVCKNTCRQPTQLCGASWGRKKSCDAAISDTEEAGASSVCRSCRCEWCGSVKWRSKACHSCQWRLAPPPYQAVHQYSTTLSWMIPVDLVAFVIYASLKNPLQAVVFAQLWCPVCIKFVAESVSTGTSVSAASRGASGGHQSLAAAMIALYKQLSMWRAATSPEWQWHQRYMSVCHEGGGHLKVGPEAVGKRWGFVLPAPNKESTKQVVVFTNSGTQNMLDAEGGKQMFKRMSQQLQGCKWHSSALAVSQGASSSARVTPGAGRPSTAKRDVAAIMKQHQLICEDVQKLGSALPALKMGQDSAYIRPHVCRKLFLSLMHATGWTLATFPWKKLTMDQLTALGPDMQGYVKSAPSHWSHKSVEIFVGMDAAGGGKVPLVMHGCWSCLFGYATSSTYGQGMGESAVQYIAEGHSEEFERCARELCVSSGVQPTPLKVMREILVKKWQNKEDTMIDLQGPWGEPPALFPAQVPGLPVSFGIAPPENRQGDTSGEAG